MDPIWFPPTNADRGATKDQKIKSGREIQVKLEAAFGSSVTQPCTATFSPQRIKE